MAHSTAVPRGARTVSAAVVALIAVICFGIGCRFIGLNWDEGAHLHPDERFLVMTAPPLTWPHSITEYFDTPHAPLNPQSLPQVGMFIYGQLPLVLLKVVSAAFGRDDYAGNLLVGRALSALFDTGSVLLLFFVGRRLGGTRTGLMAAALLATTAIHIQQSHFFVVDPFANFFLLASYLYLIKWAEPAPPLEVPPSRRGKKAKAAPPEPDRPARRKPWFAAGCGICWGAAMACKISAAFFGLVPVLMILLMAREARSWRTAFITVPVVCGCALLSLRLLHPMAFQGMPAWYTLDGFLDIRPTADYIRPDGSQTGFWNSARVAADILSGQSEVPWTLQFIGRRDFIWPLRNLFLAAVGVSLMLSGIAGLGSILWENLAPRRAAAAPAEDSAVSSRWRQHAWLVAAIWSAFIFFYYARWFAKFTRYYLVMTPFLALCAAYVLVRLLEAPATGAARTIRQAVVAIVVATSALWAAACTSIYLRPNTRVAATKWIQANIPAQTPVAVETGWDDALPLGGAGNLHMLDTGPYDLYQPDDSRKREGLLHMLDTTTWYFSSSNRAWGSIPRVPMRYPLTIRFYRALFDGSLGFELAQQFASYPRLSLLGHGFSFPDDSIEEAWSVYDHPRVLLFRKTAAYSRANADRILDPALLLQAQVIPESEIIKSGWRPDEATLPQPPPAP